MRRFLAASALALLTASSPLRAGSSFTSGPYPQLSNLSASIDTANRVHYVFGATSQGYGFTGEGVWDPATRQASEKLTQLNGNTINSRATCDADPWAVEASGCRNSLVQSPGYPNEVSTGLLQLTAPIGAHLMNSPDHRHFQEEYEKAVAAKAAAAKAAADRKAAEERKQAAIKAATVHEGITKGGTTHTVSLATPVPTRAASTSAVLHPALSVGGPAKTPTPAYPLYGAVYTPSNLAQIKVNQTGSIAVTVKNASSQTWPANGAFRLAYHWYKGSALADYEGQRTVFAAPVPPGGQVVLNATVRGPASAGAYTIKWDMVQEGVTWFSNKGVATADQPVAVVP